MSTSEPLLRQRDDGKKLHIFGDVEFLVKVSSEESGGAFTLMDSLNPAGTYMPPHLHTTVDETFYILEGAFEFEVDGRVLRAGPGATVFAPRGIPHSLKVTSDTAGRALVLTAPGGFDRCIEDLAALPSDPPDMTRAFEVCWRHGIEFLPPPPSTSQAA
jgi:quercetin dioxygenase-like cupin family protein